jgi:hypothetical protein
VHHPEAGGAGHGGGAVVGAVVDHHHLGRCRLLRGQVGEQHRQRAGFVAGGHDHRDLVREGAAGSAVEAGQPSQQPPAGEPAGGHDGYRDRTRHRFRDISAN